MLPAVASDAVVLLSLGALVQVNLRHALGESVAGVSREQRAAGVLMLHPTQAGQFQAVLGVEAAEAVPGIESVVVSAHADQTFEPLPDGAVYAGFAFARGETPQQVEASLRAARALLEVCVEAR